MNNLIQKLQAILTEKNKIIPENIKKDIKIFGVTGTLERGTSGAKLFETAEQMQADTTVKEGDLALVYRDELKHSDANSQFQIAVFPEIVVLPQAFTDYADLRYRAIDPSQMFDCWGQLDSNRFSMSCYTQSGSIRISYSSEDGITYTRTSLQGDGVNGNTVDFGMEIKYDYPQAWNDVIGYFILVGGQYFEGLYKNTKVELIDKTVYQGNYTTILNNNLEKIYVQNMHMDYANITSDSNLEDVLPVLKLCAGFVTEFEEVESIDNMLTIKPKVYYKLYGKMGSLAILCRIVEMNNKLHLGIYHSGSLDTATFWLLKYDNGNVTCTTLNGSNFSNSNNSQYKICTLFEFEKCGVFYDNPNSSQSYYDSSVVFEDGTTQTIKSPGNNASENKYYRAYNELQYVYAPTQLTLQNPNELLPNCISYGKNGIVTGDGSISQPDNTFMDIPAQLYYNIQNEYDKMDVRVLTDSDKTIDKGIYVIPVKSDGTILIDTSNLTSMYNIFGNCKNLGSIPKLNTSNATSFQQTFNYCENLTTIALLDTSKATNTSYMFNRCSKLTHIPNFDTSNVTNISYMFNRCSSLTSVPLLNTSNATNMEGLFEGCSSLETIPELDIHNTTNIGRLVMDCSKLKSVPFWNTSHITKMYFLFYGCSSLTSIPAFDTSNVTDMAGMFSGCESLTTIPSLNTANVTNMNSMFSGCSNLVTLPALNTSKVVGNMSNMFSDCAKLTAVPEGLDTSNATQTEYMFYKCASLTSIPALNLNKATAVNFMFEGCTNLETVPNIDLSNVTEMNGLFQDCAKLTTIPVLNTSKATRMENVFSGCTNLTTIPVLNTSKVTGMYNMFNKCPNLSNETLSNILTMCKNATSLNEWDKTFKGIGLTSTQVDICKTLSDYQACIDAGWTTGY